MRSSINCLFEEMGRERAAIGDYLEEGVRKVDACLEGGSQQVRGRGGGHMYTGRGGGLGAVRRVCVVGGGGK